MQQRPVSAATRSTGKWVDADSLFRELDDAGVTWHDFRKYKEERSYATETAKQSLYSRLFESLVSRLPWLTAMLLLLSFSSEIVAHFESLLASHMAITMFLTTIVGTGGNAGSQATSRIIRMLASQYKGFSRAMALRLLSQEAILGAIQALVLALVLFVRIIPQHGLPVAIALSFSLGIVVMAAVTLGAAIPLMLSYFGMDPVGGATPLLTTVLDVGGVSILMVISSLILG